MKNGNSFKYFYINRPAGYGCQPDGFDRHEAWIPARSVEGLGDRAFLGEVEYPIRLSPVDVWKYDLLPADPVERAKYALWLNCDRDAVEAERVFVEYRSLGLDELKKRVDDLDSFDPYPAIVYSIMRGE